MEHDPREELDQTQEEMARERVFVEEHVDRERMTSVTLIPEGTPLPAGVEPGIIEARPLPVVRPTLGALLARLAAVDELLEADVDPAELVGDVRDKVDAIKGYLDRLSALDAYLDTQIRPLDQAQEACRRNATRLKTYVRDQMVENKFEKLPGDVWRAQLQSNGGVEPLVIAEGRLEPTPQDFTQFPGLVKMVRYYEWDMAKVRAFLEGGETLPFAKLTERGKQVRFYVNKDTNKVQTSKAKKGKDT